MARNLILQNLTKLARGIGASHHKWTGTRTNINFLGKGPTKNPLFQGPLQGLESASEAQLGSREAIIGSVEDAMGYASAGKLNGIQLRALELNLENIFKIYNPPLATVSQLPKRGSGIAGLPRGVDPNSEIAKSLRMERGAEKMLSKMSPKEVDLRGQFPTASDDAIRAMAVDIPQKTHAARATMIRLLDMEAGQGGQTLREIMSPTDLKFLLEGGGGAKGDPIALFAKYFGNATTKQIPSPGTPEVIEEFATQVIRRKDRLGRGINDLFFRPEEIDFAHGGLARILEI